MRSGLITFLIILILDQLSKVWVVQWLNLKEIGSLEVLPPLLNFQMAWNRGVNFGLFASDGNHWVLIGIALVVTAFVLYWVREETDMKVHVSTGLLVGGAIGNIVDRLIYGAVADFLNMSCCGISNPFSFNIADIAIFAGAIGLVIWSGKEKAT